MSIDKEQIKQAISEMFEMDNLIKDFSEEKEYTSSNRAKMWDIFAEEVRRHIEKYTVPQYGDFPDDNATTCTENDCITQIHKYINRVNSNARGEIESNRDLFKMAHYVSLIWCKRLDFDTAMTEVLNDNANGISDKHTEDV